MKLIHLIIICLVISMIVIVLKLPHFFACTEKPRWDSVRPKMAPIESAIATYKLNTAKLPVTLENLIICPNGLENVWKGPYLKESQLYDPWDRLFIYNITEDDYELISYGNDGISGGEGYNADIYNY